jgi:hypothetical protein
MTTVLLAEIFSLEKRADKRKGQIDAGSTDLFSAPSIRGGGAPLKLRG